MGIEAEDLVKTDNNLTPEDLEQFLYPHDKEIKMVGVRGIYLNNYIRWDSKSQHEKMIKKYNYETMYQQRTFDTYSDVDSFHYSGIHDVIKLVKYGYSKVTDHACREIRLKRMSRDEGIDLIRKYRFIKSRDVDLFIEWMGISLDEYNMCVMKFRNIDVCKENEILCKSSYGEVINKFDLNSVSKMSYRYDKFKINQKNHKCIEDKYVLIGRGYIDK